MTRNLIYLALVAYFAFLPAIVLGLLVGLIDKELGAIMVGVVFGWKFIELISKRKSKW